jgi:hypothetical protein
MRWFIGQASLHGTLTRPTDRSSFQIRCRWRGHRRDGDLPDKEALMIEESKSGVNIKTGFAAL